MLEIKTKKEGAELESIKFNGEEKLHDGIKDWKRHAPILFPIVGSLKNGETIIEGKKYEMSQHGFARDSEFEKIGENNFLLKYNEETLKKYPYKFELNVLYEINENELITKYKIKNVDNKKIYFGLGGHPAFLCDYKNCEIEFEKQENEIEFYLLENGLIKNTKEEKEKYINENIIKLNSDFFNFDAVIMKKLKSNKISLIENNKKILEFNFEDFPILAIWSKKDADFLCIEPWMNTADCVTSDGIYTHKEGIISLNENEVFEAKYSVRFF